MFNLHSCNRPALAGLLWLLAGTQTPASRPAHSRELKPFSILQCTDVTLHAVYLAEERPGTGPGFLLTIHNATSLPITLPRAIPLSIHWYALSNGHWLWRSSSGDGGALVNALRKYGPVFAATKKPSEIIETIAIAPKQGYTWSTPISTNAVLRYRPGCEHCTFLNEHRFRAVLAYTYVPAQEPDGMLQCGLRSEPVEMPPLENR